MRCKYNILYSCYNMRLINNIFFWIAKEISSKFKYAKR